MSFLSLEQIKNEFKVNRLNNSFTLSRNITESVDANDLLRMRDNLEREIENYKEEIKNLEDKKAEFDKWAEIAEALREAELSNHKEQRLKYLAKKDINKKDNKESSK